MSMPDRDPFHTTVNVVRAMCEGAGGWQMHPIGHWNHPRSQQIVRFTRVI